MNEEQKHEMLTGMDEGEVKKVMKEALKEWLDEKFTDLGKWSLASIAVAALGVLGYFIIRFGGWRHP